MVGSQVSKERFDELLREPLGEFYERALTIFCNFGRHCSSDVTLILLHAAEQEKVAEVLAILAQHWEEYLKSVHVELRGAQADAEGGNPTKVLFYRIYQETLKLDVI